QTSYIYHEDILKVDRLFDFSGLARNEADFKQLMPQIKPLQFRMKSGASFHYSELYDEVTKLIVSDLYREDIYLHKFISARNMRNMGLRIQSRRQDTNLHKFINARRSCNVGLRRQKSQSPQRLFTALPRKIWMYWHQGWERAPFVVRECLKSWMLRNP